jgi:CYTH domain-containing protein
MGREIERRFLVNGGWPKRSKGMFCIQAYLPTKGRHVVRMRIMGKTAAIAIKAKGKGISRTEFEYPIPIKDAFTIIETLCAKPCIEKTRYKIRHKGVLWEIDVFEGENKGLIIAEVELESEDQKFDLPDWVGKEITHDPRYLNVNLAKHPFTKWTKTQRSERRGKNDAGK